ncbi:hypothetical protein CLV98_105255 [Dyadobacter jejuensis]|uniref:DUF6916 domain-containing protein n=1 Tax=Dyadobacter jejuensis TaxID=1082580 RepID=A0A316AJY8_9BACT|nr:hypothetical protein [Dyadobacter jejuensis]PWJ58073.1 hypothetical protein CLV98_105255 [Dyadobacter jejuensis]
MEKYDLSKVTEQDFRDHLGQKLYIEFTLDQAEPVIVTKITPLETYSPIKRGAFSVVLQTEGVNDHWPQGIYRLLHPSTGLFEVFLVPIGADQNGMQYEVIFS